MLIALGLREMMEEIANSPDAMSRKHHETGDLIGIDASPEYEAKYGAPYWQAHRAAISTTFWRARCAPTTRTPLP